MKKNAEEKRKNFLAGKEGKALLRYTNVHDYIYWGAFVMPGSKIGRASGVGLREPQEEEGTWRKRNRRGGELSRRFTPYPRPRIIWGRRVTPEVKLGGQGGKLGETEEVSVILVPLPAPAWGGKEVRLKARGEREGGKESKGRGEVMLGLRKDRSLPPNTPFTLHCLPLTLRREYRS